MQNYEVTIEGKTPLIFHADNIEWSDKMDAWKADPKNKKTTKPGDDRSPAWRWFGCLYHDGKQVCMPADNLMRCMMEGGAQVPVPGGKSGKTFKSQTQSGMLVRDPFSPLLVGGKAIEMAALEPLLKEESFDRHQEALAKLGVMLFVKRAKIGQSKHIRVRPRFDMWGCKLVLSVWDQQLTQDVLGSILSLAGQYKGLGDWRPGGKTPGPYGMFNAKIRKV